MKSTPKVIAGTIELESGKVIELTSTKGIEWVSETKSFIYVPSADIPEFGVRQELKGKEPYWYGYRRSNGKLHKRYIGRITEVNENRLDYIGRNLESGILDEPKEPKQMKKNKTEERLATLEAEVQELRKAIAKDAGTMGEGAGSEAPENNEELPKAVGNSDKELPKAVGNSDEIARLNEQVKSLQAELFDTIQTLNQLEQTEKSAKKALIESEKARFALSDRIEELEQPAAKEPIEAAELLNELKKKRKKSSATLGDVQLLLELFLKQ